MRYKESVIFQKGGTANHSPFTSKTLVKGFYESLRLARSDRVDDEQYKMTEGQVVSLHESLRLARSDRVDDEQYKMTEGQVVSFARITTTGAKRQSR